MDVSNFAVVALLTVICILLVAMVLRMWIENRELRTVMLAIAEKTSNQTIKHVPTVNADRLLDSMQLGEPALAHRPSTSAEDHIPAAPLTPKRVVPKTSPGLSPRDNIGSPASVLAVSHVSPFATRDESTEMPVARERSPDTFSTVSDTPPTTPTAEVPPVPSPLPKTPAVQVTVPATPPSRMPLRSITTATFDSSAADSVSSPFMSPSIDMDRPDGVSNELYMLLRSLPRVDDTELQTLEAREMALAREEDTVSQQFKVQIEAKQLNLQLMREEVEALRQRLASLMKESAQKQQRRDRLQKEIDEDEKAELQEENRVRRLLVSHAVPLSTAALSPASTPTPSASASASAIAVGVDSAAIRHNAVISPTVSTAQKLAVSHLSPQSPRSRSPRQPITPRSTQSTSSNTSASRRRGEHLVQVQQRQSPERTTALSKKVSDFLNRQQYDIGLRDSRVRTSREYSPFQFRNASPDGPEPGRRRAKSASKESVPPFFSTLYSGPLPATQEQRRSKTPNSLAPYLQSLAENAHMLESVLLGAATFTQPDRST